MSVLSQILADKRTEVDCARRRVPVEELQARVADMPAPRDFLGALMAAARPALIAEVKRASPSKGIIRHDFDPIAIARTYADNGAACLSILTDEPYFQGHLSYLAAIRGVIDLPLLRKDFIIDEYQLLESRAAGADAVLLIEAALQSGEMRGMVEAARALGMAAIVEVHDRAELEEVLTTPVRILGINNRDLHLFRTSLQTTIDLLPLVPADRVVVSESGINTRADVERLREAGAHAVLVGESLMRELDIAGKMRELLGR
ncbi:MAG: indole-3-glycerol phosphate synthase TrpC [Chthonomonadales bacterium]|nr:indole-3-glycerol phosphate synthase TrpC [Chthonomonadales bacterium]